MRLYRKSNLQPFGVQDDALAEPPGQGGNSCFRATLGLQQNWAEGTELSHIPLAPTYA